MSKVVIVDDQPVNRAVYAKMAESVASDVCVTTHGDPYEAFQRMLDETPDLIITDYQMPWHERSAAHP